VVQAFKDSFIKSKREEGGRAEEEKLKQTPG